jgi:hypothetical protein
VQIDHGSSTALHEQQQHKVLYGPGYMSATSRHTMSATVSCIEVHLLSSRAPTIPVFFSWALSFTTYYLPTTTRCIEACPGLTMADVIAAKNCMILQCINKDTATTRKPVVTILLCPLSGRQAWPAIAAAAGLC